MASTSMDLAGSGSRSRRPAVPILRAARSQVAAARRGGRVRRDEPPVSTTARRRGRPAARRGGRRPLALAPFRTTLEVQRRVFELRPSAAWNKGEAALYFRHGAQGRGRRARLVRRRAAHLRRRRRWTGLVQGPAPFGAVAGARDERAPARTHATHRLRDVDDVRAFLDALAARAEAPPATGDASTT